MDKTAINLARIRAYDWEESEHPRADNGQFTSGGGSATKEGLSSKTTETTASNSPFKEAVKEVKSKFNSWSNKRDNAAANEAADVFLSELGDSDDVLSAVQAAKEHLESVKEDIVDIDGDDSNWDDAMYSLNEIEEKFANWDSKVYSSFYGKSNGSPLLEAAKKL